MSWEQSILGAQVSVNRAVFEMNRGGMLPPIRKDPNPEYIKHEVREAIKDLTNALKILDNELDF